MLNYTMIALNYHKSAKHECCISMHKLCSLVRESYSKRKKKHFILLLLSIEITLLMDFKLDFKNVSTRILKTAKYKR